MLKRVERFKKNSIFLARTCAVKEYVDVLMKLGLNRYEVKIHMMMKFYNTSIHSFGYSHFSITEK